MSHENKRKEIATAIESANPMYDLETQYEKGVGEYSFNYGSMFHIISFQNMSVTSLDIHTSSIKKKKIQVWTTKGSFLNRTDNANDYGWTLVFDRMIRGKGMNMPTSLPSDFFQAVEVVNDDEGQSFFISSPKSPTIANLEFNGGNDTKTDQSVFAENSHLNVMVGIGISEPSFSDKILQDQVWSGAIWYSIHEDVLITLPPVAEEYEIITGFGGSDSLHLHGNLFDVYANDNLVVTSIDIHTDIKAKTLIVKVYSKLGSIRDNTTTWNDWSEIANATITGNGRYGSTPIPSSMFSPVIILAGTIRSFFVTLDSSNLICTAASTYFPGAVWKQDDHVEILLGVGTRDYPVNLDSGSTYYHENIGWNGVIRYSLDLEIHTLSKSLTYYILIDHSMEGPFLTQEYIGFLKNKWEVAIAESGSLSFFDYSEISRSNGDRSPFCDVYNTGRTDSECYILQIKMSIFYKNEYSIASKDTLIKEAQNINSYFLSDDPSLSINFIGPDIFSLNFSCTFTGYFDRMEFTSVDLSFLEETITTFLSKEFDEYPHGTSITNTSIVNKEVDFIQDIRQRQNQRRLVNVIGSLSIDATITGELHSVISSTTTLLDDTVGDLVLSTFYASEGDFLGYINTDATFKGVQYITYQISQTSEENIENTTNDKTVSNRTWFIVFIVGLVFVIIPLVLLIEWYRILRKQKKVTKLLEVEEQQPQTRRKARGSSMTDTPNTRKAPTRRGSTAASIEKGRAGAGHGSTSGTTVASGRTTPDLEIVRTAKTDVDRGESMNDDKLVKKRLRRDSLGGNMVPQKDGTTPARPGQRARKRDGREPPKDRTKQRRASLSAMPKALPQSNVYTSNEDLELLEDDEDQFIRSTAKAYSDKNDEEEIIRLGAKYNSTLDGSRPGISTESEAKKRLPHRRRASIGCMSKVSSDNRPPQNKRMQRRSSLSATRAAVNSCPTELDNRPEISTEVRARKMPQSLNRRASITGSMSSLSATRAVVNSCPTELDNRPEISTEVRARKMPRSLNRRASIAGSMTSDESGARLRSTEVQRGTSPNDKRTARRASLSSIPLKKDSSENRSHCTTELEDHEGHNRTKGHMTLSSNFSRSSRGMMDQSMSSCSKSLDKSVVEVEQRRKTPSRRFSVNATTPSNRQFDTYKKSPTLDSSSGIDTTIDSSIYLESNSTLDNSMPGISSESEAKKNPQYLSRSASIGSMNKVSSDNRPPQDRIMQRRFSLSTTQAAAKSCPAVVDNRPEISAEVKARKKPHFLNRRASSTGGMTSVESDARLRSTEVQRGTSPTDEQTSTRTGLSYIP